MLSATTIVRIRRALPCLARRADRTTPILVLLFCNDSKPILAYRQDYPDARYQQLLSGGPRRPRGQREIAEAKKNRPQTPKRTRPKGLQEIRKEQRRESADFDQNQKTIKFKIGHRIPQYRKEKRGAVTAPPDLLAQRIKSRSEQFHRIRSAKLGHFFRPSNQLIAQSRAVLHDSFGHRLFAPLQFLSHSLRRLE